MNTDNTNKKPELNTMNNEQVLSYLEELND